MVRLLLLRHAKSAHPPGLHDLDRPLCDRGRRSAVLIGEWLSKRAVEPAVVLCSSASRCADTLALILPFFQTRPELHYRPGMYLAQSPALLKAMRTAPERSPLLVVGHNPGLHEFGLAMLSPCQPPGAAERAAEFGHKFPTAALAIIDFLPDRWGSIKPASGILAEFVRPQTLLATEDDE